LTGPTSAAELLYDGDNCETAVCTPGFDGVHACCDTCENGGTITGTPLTDNCGCSCLDGYGGDSCEKSGVNYSQFKFNLDPAGDHTGLRGWDSAAGVQLSEIAMYDGVGTYIEVATAANGNAYIASCTNPGGNSPTETKYDKICGVDILDGGGDKVSCERLALTVGHHLRTIDSN
jgi:hypothetical protein